MISVITPTNNPKYLLEAFESLKEQTISEWEWILVPNNGGTVQEEIERHPNCRIVSCDSDKIGELKNFACSLAQYPIILEFDHDDLLLPTALEEAVKAFENPNIVFVYSNGVEFNQENFTPHTYSAAHGWRYREFEWNGHKLQEPIAFKATPHSLGYIYYAPNHFRAWRKSTYDKIGGHDKSMRVIDDQDLMCKLYLEGEFHHIDKPLYLYRVHGENSWLKRNAEIQVATRECYKKYIQQMVSIWCDRQGYIKLDIGAERGKSPEGWKTIDIRSGCDYQADLSRGFPFADNSIGAIRAQDFLEHIKDQVFLMNEIHRVLVPGGWLFSSTPSTDGRGAWQDPTHVSFWNQNSFWYYTKKQLQHFVPEIKARFQAFRNETIFPSKWHEDNKICYVNADMIALKPGYDRPEDHIPGLIEI